MKRALLLILAAVLVLSCFSFAGAEGTGENGLLELWDWGGESMTHVASAIPVGDGAAIVSSAVLPQNTDTLALSDGVNTWEVKAVLPDREGRIAVLFYEAEGKPSRYDGWHLLPLGASVSAASCVVKGTGADGLAVSRGVLSSAGIHVGGRRFLLLSLDGPVPLGSALLTAEGQLAGIVAADWAEGVNRVLALPADGIAESLAGVAALLNNLPAWGEAPEGLTVTLDKNLATVDWKEMTLPEKKEGEELYLVVFDTGNSYISFYPAETMTSATMVLTPGRYYIAGILASAERPNDIPESYVTISVPQAEQLTEYGFHPVLTCIAEAPEGGLKDGDAPAPVPATEVTEELLRSGRAYFYSHSTYQVTENVEGKTLLITLTTPDGNNYRHESSWLYAPEYMAEDIWFLSLKDIGLTTGLDQGGYPKGTYQMAFYVDGDLADSFEFILK